MHRAETELLDRLRRIGAAGPEGWEDVLQVVAGASAGPWRAGDDGPALLQSALDSPDAEVRDRAVRSLAAVPGDSATALLRDALTLADPAARRLIVQALADVPGATAESALALLSRDDDRAVALTAAHVVRQRGGLPPA